jgi:hypothetical protein
MHSYTIYDQFIHTLKSTIRNLGKQKGLEKHPILPIHDGGLKSGETVLCTPKNHTLAHYYRF